MTAAAPRFADYPAHVRAVYAAALRAVEPAAAVERWLRPEDYAEAERIYVVGAGKAGVGMATAVAAQLGDRLTAGVLSVPHPPVDGPARIRFVEGGHPQPTEGTLRAGQAMADLLSATTERDLVLALISGGASALLELLRPGLTLADLQQTNAALLRSGAAIHEVNVVRTRLSQLKGGGLARLAAPARVLALILSDVVGNPLPSIGSGPTVVAAAHGPEAALTIVDKYGMRAQLPAAVLQQLGGESASPPGPLSWRREAKASARRGGVAIRDEQVESVVENRLIGTNALAGEAALEEARALGFAAEWLGDDWQGEARDVGARLAEVVLARAGSPQPVCLLAGGETTVTMRGHGRGGRNQEVALAAALALAGAPNVAVASLATDGIDGPTDAAGAVVTGATVGVDEERRRAAQAHLEANDSYAFLEERGALVVTGASGTNVNDLLLGLIY